MKKPSNSNTMLKKIVWDDIPTDQVTPKMARKMIYGDQIMIAQMKFKDGFVVPLHSHHHEQITSVQKGTIRFWFGENKEQVMDVHAGESVVIPGHLPHEALMIGDVEETDTWSPPREDWIDGSDDYLRK